MEEEGRVVWVGASESSQLFFIFFVILFLNNIYKKMAKH
jgi:hypothetical protein